MRALGEERRRRRRRRRVLACRPAHTRSPFRMLRPGSITWYLPESISGPGDVTCYFVSYSMAKMQQDANTGKSSQLKAKSESILLPGQPSRLSGPARSSVMRLRDVRLPDGRMAGWPNSRMAGSPDRDLTWLTFAS